MTSREINVFSWHLAILSFAHTTRQNYMAVLGHWCAFCVKILFVKQLGDTQSGVLPYIKLLGFVLAEKGKESTPQLLDKRPALRRELWSKHGKISGTNIIDWLFCIFAERICVRRKRLVLRRCYSFCVKISFVKSDTANTLSGVSLNTILCRIFLCGNMRENRPLCRF